MRQLNRFYSIFLLNALFSLFIPGELVKEDQDQETTGVSPWIRIDQYMLRSTDSKYEMMNIWELNKWSWRLYALSCVNSIDQELSKLYEALKKLIQFKNNSLRGTSKCDKDAYELRNFFENLKGDFKRLNVVIKFLCGKHSKYCQDRHAKYYNELPLHKDHVDQIETILYNIIYLVSSEENSDTYTFNKHAREDLIKVYANKEIRKKMINKFIENEWKEIASKKNAELIYEAISALARKNKEHKFVRDNVMEINENRMITGEKGIKELLRIFLMESCDYFVKTTTLEVFGPARKDFETLKRVDKLDKTRASYFFAWAQYEICETLLKNENLKRKLEMKVKIIAQNSAKAMENFVPLSSTENEKVDEIFSSK